MRYLTLPLAVALALASPCALALGLGQLQVKSGLNQPLVAEIPIISATPSELDQLDVRLASPEAFSAVGLERPSDLTANLQFSVGKNARGMPVIRVTTPGRFAEPLLSFLIEADWGKGRVTREYTALIDPPYIAQAIVQPMLAPSVAATPAPVAIAPAVAAAPPPAPQPAQTVPAQEPEPAPVTATPEPQPIVQAPPPVEAPLPPPAPRQVAPPPTPQPVAVEPAPEPTPAPAPPTAPAEPGRYGPVAPGQTLFGIANSVRPDPSVSVNQMMVALLRANPDAFAQDNMNVLKRGSVLRVPGQDEVTTLSDSDAAALVSQQAAAWRAPRQAAPQPAESANDETVAATPAPSPTAAPRVASRRPARNASRLEIVPPSGNAAARGTQSGAAAGAGGTELRAELAQAREDLAARTSEVTELKSRIAELEQQDTDRQRLVEMQNSQLKDMQDRLAQLQAAEAAAPAASASVMQPAGETPAGVAAAPADTPPATPWYLNPFVIGGAVLVVIGAFVLGLRRSKVSNGDGNGDPAPRRLSEDDALRASMAKTRAASEKIVPDAAKAGVVAAPAKAATSADAELGVLRDAVKARPQDIEAHLSLLRFLHGRGNFNDYEAAAQEMRANIPNTMDPRWREAVIMGASLMPANSQFAQSGWNTPRFGETEATAAAAAAAAAPMPAPVPMRAANPAPPTPAASPAMKPAIAAVPAAAVAPPRADVPPLKVFEAPASESKLDEFDFGDHGHAVAGGRSGMDIHRNEALILAEDEASATRIELAKAYLDIGDLDGARSMLEEVVAEGGPTAQAEATRILKEIG